eukprot:gnl/MRDRNA2_/MRDRNA2_158023_c0_seq1.p1 gnl/MRDRNA2_/MRDRNA2_158023_c0~~gnl/MRDRNA2_/MRDRNA2_158023_c0_seq1.p1  ORF type:complete len:493 (+),score=84.61 gnl/MRDRNA2_/MRDRNA2_158023_c0_seq1:130-1608(+)
MFRRKKKNESDPETATPVAPTDTEASEENEEKRSSVVNETLVELHMRAGDSDFHRMILDYLLLATVPLKRVKELQKTLGDPKRKISRDIPNCTAWKAFRYATDNSIDITVEIEERNFVLPLKNTNTVLELKEMIQAKMRIPASELRVALKESKQTLQDDGKTLAQSGISALGESTVVAQQRPNFAVTGCCDGTMQFWNLTNDKMVRSIKLPGQMNYVWCVEVDLQTVRAVSGSHDGVIRLWNLRTGDVERQYDGHKSDVTCISVSWRNKFIWSGSKDKTLRLYQMDRAETKVRFKGHFETVRSCAQEWEGQIGRGLSCSDDATLRLWALTSGECIHIMEGHYAIVACCCFDWAVRMGASGASDGSLKLWNLETGQQKRHFEGHDGPVLSIALDWRSMQAITGGFDCTVKLWDMRPKPPKEERKPTGWVLWSSDTASGHTQPVTCVCLDWPQKRAISVANDGTMRMWDLTKKELRRKWEHEKRRKLLAVAMSG